MIVFLYLLLFFLLKDSNYISDGQRSRVRAQNVIRFIDHLPYINDDIYALCFVSDRWEDFMGEGDFVLYHNKEKDFEVGDIQGEVNSYRSS